MNFFQTLESRMLMSVVPVTVPTQHDLPVADGTGTVCDYRAHYKRSDNARRLRLLQLDLLTQLRR